ncbi:MAG TPA: hypothetical protein VFB80_06200 [Pirellulaceae bacterium]|nr:hypothetical protein [Pirellulaceae bacterium]
MNDDVLLTLHCPKCAELVEVVAEGNNLVCLECGWKFDDRIAAKFLNPQPQEENA